MSDAPLPDDDEEPQDEPEPVVTRDLTDPKQERRFRDKLKRQEQERASFWRAVLNDKIGRREMWRLIAVEGHAFTTDFRFGPVGFPDPHATMHQMGAQQNALKLYHDLLRIDFEGIRTMHAENDPRFIEVKPQKPVP